MDPETKNVLPSRVVFRDIATVLVARRRNAFDVFLARGTGTTF